MKFLSFLVTLCTSALFLNAQDCAQYSRLMDEARMFINDGKFIEALNKYQSAQMHCKSKLGEVQNKIKEMFLIIDNLKIKARLAEKKAVNAKKSLEEKNRQLSSKEIELQSKNQELISYGNRLLELRDSVFNLQNTLVLQRSKYLMEYKLFVDSVGKQQKTNLASIVDYIDTLIQNDKTNTSLLQRQVQDKQPSETILDSLNIRKIKGDDGKIDIVFVQVNDVYEIGPHSGGKEGGMARVATLKKQYQQTNANTFLVMAGDFLSPSVYNSLMFEGKRIRGQQMVDAMNAAGMDIAIFGNHEFDINEMELQDRIDKSRFQWISTNSFHKTKAGTESFQKAGAGALPKTYIIQIKDEDGTTVKIGFFAITLPYNAVNYVTYTDPLQSAREAYGRLKDSVDAVIAITHQAMEEDERLAKELPGLAAIIGGHEHDGRYAKIGNVTITKAVANATYSYVVKLNIDKKLKKLKVQPELRYINELIPFDSATNIVVNRWLDIAQQNYSSLGFNLKEVILRSGGLLDGREEEVNSRSTDLTKLIAAAIAEAAPRADIVLFNAGIIRLDDVLQPPVTQYDIVRSLPFGGDIVEADMKGDLVIKALDAGRKNVGLGGFLHYNDALRFDNITNTWKYKNDAIDTSKAYHVALPHFLFTGNEVNMGFLNSQNPDVVKVYPNPTRIDDPLSDIRLAVVRYLQKRN